MIRKTLTAAILAASIRAALAADPAALSVVVFDQGRPVPRTEVWIDGNVAGRTDRDGAIVLSVPAGSRELILRSDGRDVLRLDLDFAEGERAELIASLQADAPAQVQYESSEAGRPAPSVESADATAGPPGTIAGRVVSSDGGMPVANARIFLSGTALDIRSDADGRFQVDLPPGSYSMSVIAANFDSRSFEGIALEPEQTLSRDIELTPAGIELPEFVVLEPYVEGSLAAFVEEKRTSAQVLDLLGAEQISRTGDSDAAGALKRVTGLTLVDGRFIYVRGLGERYSSVLLNGAQVPSPDPTRRVVPLDLFPTEVLEGIGVQKTYSADMPGEFAGGTVQLRTRSYPDSLQIKAQLSGKYAQGTTGGKGDRYTGSSRDWTGRDRSARSRPEQFDTGVMPVRNTADMQALATGIAGQGYNTVEQRLDPGTGLSASIGNSFGDSVRLGFIAAFRYQHDWDHREEFRRFYTPASGGGQVVEAEFDVSTTTRSIDGSGFFSAGADFGENHALRTTSMLLRQTSDRVQNRLGFDQGADQIQRRFLLEWIENALVTHQVSGEHRFPILADLKVDWQYTRSRAQRLLPNLRSYRLQRNIQTGEFFFQNSGANLNHRWERLDDSATEYRLDLELPLTFGDRFSTAWQAGAGRLQRDRESRIDRLRFCSNNQRTGPTVEDVINPDTVGSVATPTSPCLPFFVENQSQREDYYLADQTLRWAYLGVDLNFADRHRVNFGLRREEIDQLVLNRQLANPNATPQTGELDESDDLLGLTYTWAYSDKAQVRAAYSETLSRPEFREKARSTYIDPVLDISVIGNLDVEQTAIKNYDLRWEYYFSATETFSVALFGKQFDKPIELVRVAGTGDLLEVKNAESADLYGVEIDYYQGLGFVENWRWVRASVLDRLPWDKLTVGLNYARIESEVSLGDSIGIQTTDNRPLQFQSPYVLNFQIGFDHPDWGTEASLLYNQFGRRLFQVGVSGQNDVYEEPSGQLDFVLNQKLSDDWKFKLRLRNLLDPTIRYQQGDDTAREFRKGREISVALEWSW